MGSYKDNVYALLYAIFSNDAEEVAVDVALLYFHLLPSASYKIRKFTQEELNDMQQLYKERHMKLRYIAEKYNVSTMCIWRKLEKGRS